MPRSGPVGANRPPALFRRIRYEPELERAAFQRLAEYDVDGCRKNLAALVGRLELQRERRSPQVIQLLADILHKVNRRVHRGLDKQAAYQWKRVSLIEQFSACNEAEAARACFLPALNGLLARIEPGARSSHPLVEKAKGYIDSNYHGRLSLSSVASRLNVSPNYLSRVFRREAGTTLTAHIQRVRLQHALPMLADGRHSISEIAYLVGYRNYRDFYRNFVKYERASPREVRQRMSRAG